MDTTVVKVVEYDPNWKNLFKIEEKIFNEIIFKDYYYNDDDDDDDDNNKKQQQLIVNVFHCGSTSVKGLKAKPIIDILLVVHGNINELDKMNDRFEKCHYEIKGENGIKGRRFFKKRIENSIWVNVHAFQFDNITDIERHLSFRDYLESHPLILNEYANLKSELALKFPNSIENYCDGKDKWIKYHEKKSLQWYWSNRYNKYNN